MSFNLPDSSETVVSRSQQDVKGELPSSNPWLPSGLIRSVSVSMGNRVFDYYRTLTKSLNQAFPDRAKGENLKFWGWLKDMTPITADKASGEAVFTGTLAATASIGDIIQIGELQYELQDAVTIASNAISVSSLTASGTTATCTTATAHGMGSGMSGTISGANESDWNDTWDDITVTGDTTFTFTVTAGITSPATGTIIVTHVSGAGTVEATTTGYETNQDGGTQLETATTITGIDATVYTQYAGLTGGLDDESATDFKERVIYRWRNPQTPFNPATIESTIKGINGNTRVWVKRLWNHDTATTEPGCVSAYFVRDNDDDIIPSASEVTAAETAIHAITPAHTDLADVFIKAPTGVTVSFVFGSISPDTVQMRTAIENQLDSYFRSETEEAVDVELEKLKSVIWNTYDAVNGIRLQGYTLTTPSADTTVSSGQLGVLGTVTYS